MTNFMSNIFKTILFLSPVLLFTFIFNVWWGDINVAIVILIRLIFAYLGTYIFSKVTPVREIIKCVEILTKPMSAFKINNKKFSTIREFYAA